MICALLVFQTPDLPAPLGELSPWLDWLVEPQDELFARWPRRTPAVHQDAHAARRRGHRSGGRPTSSSPAIPSTWPSRSTTRAPTWTGERMRELTGAPAPTAAPGPRPPLTSGCAAGSRTTAPTSSWTRCPAWSGTSPTRGPARPSPTSCSCTTPTCRRPRRRDAAAGARLGDRRRRGRLAGAGGGGDVRRDARAGGAARARSGGIMKDSDAFFRRGTSGAGGEVLTKGSWPATASAPADSRPPTCWVASPIVSSGGGGYHGPVPAGL